MNETAHNPDIDEPSQHNWLLGGLVWIITVTFLSTLVSIGELLNTEFRALEIVPLFIGPSTVIGAIFNDMMPVVPITLFVFAYFGIILFPLGVRFVIGYWHWGLITLQILLFAPHLFFLFALASVGWVAE